MLKLSRRQFAAGVASSVPVIHASNSKPASDRLRFGYIGSGGRARGLMRIFGGFPDVDIPVICDAIEPRMAEASEILSNEPRPHKPECVVDYRRILDRKDIDAVVIGTTQHWHGLPHIHACHAGKHIYVEKPLSLTVVEGRAMVDATKKHGVLALMGTQQRGNTIYKKAIELVRAGRLGKVGLVESWNCDSAGTRVGKPPDSVPPDGYHWDLWLGPAPYVPFNPARLRHPWWFDYSGGMLTNWAVHHIDIILSAMNASSPLAVSCTGGKIVVDDLADTPDTIEAQWEFPDFFMTYRYRGYNAFRSVQSRPRSGHGICFYGDRGTLVLDRRGYEIWEDSEPNRPVERLDHDRTAPGVKGVNEQDGPYERAFVDAVKNNNPLPIDLEHSHQTTVCCHLANIAYHVKRRIRWDGTWERILNDTDATALLDKPRRKGYELPKV